LVIESTPTEAPMPTAPMPTPSAPATAVSLVWSSACTRTFPPAYTLVPAAVEDAALPMYARVWSFRTVTPTAPPTATVPEPAMPALIESMASETREVTATSRLAVTAAPSSM
jgi:hypothetical protein